MQDGGLEVARAAAAPFAQRSARLRAAAAADATALAVLLVVGALLAVRASNIDGQPAPLHTLLLGVACCLAWRLAVPEAWARWRVPVVAALRLALAAPTAHLLERVYHATLGKNGRHATMGEPSASLFFVFTLLFNSGAIGLALVRGRQCGYGHWWAVLAPVPA